MNVQKTIAVAAAMLITAAGMAGIVNYSNAAAASYRGTANTNATTVITTLPTITVRPDPAVLRTLRKQDAAKAGSASASAKNAVMPYYSFAADEANA